MNGWMDEEIPSSFPDVISAESEKVSKISAVKDGGLPEPGCKEPKQRQANVIWGNSGK